MATLLAHFNINPRFVAFDEVRLRLGEKEEALDWFDNRIGGATAG